MPKVNIEKSKLKNSPIITDSFNTEEKQTQKGKFFDRPYVKGIIIATISTLISTILFYYLWPLTNNQQDMQKDDNTPKVNIEDSSLEKSPVIVDSPGATVNISDLDQKIQSISVEAKLLGTKKSDTENPPSSVELYSGFGNAKLKNETSTATLSIQSPVYFETTNGKIEVTNNFALQPGSQLQHQDIENIKKFPELLVPIITVVYGDTIETIKELSVVMKINSKEVFSNNWAYNVPFQQGSTFTIPLEWDSSEEPK